MRSLTFEIRNSLPSMRNTTSSPTWIPAVLRKAGGIRNSPVLADADSRLLVHSIPQVGSPFNIVSEENLDQYLTAQLPEFSHQADSREGGFCLSYGLRPPVWLQSVGVPFLGQAPSLSQRQGSSARTVPLRAPAIHVPFRPEQQHGLSGEHDVVVPVTRWHGNVDDSLRRE